MHTCVRALSLNSFGAIEEKEGKGISGENRVKAEMERVMTGIGLPSVLMPIVVPVKVVSECGTMELERG